jgi:uncharacterized ferritin-like protein (DUF455 family)
LPARRALHPSLSRGNAGAKLALTGPSYRQLLKEYDAPQLKPPFNIEARRQAGFSIGELEWLSAQT